MRFGEWRAYNQPPVAIQAPKQLIATGSEARLNGERAPGDSHRLRATRDAPLTKLI